MSLEMLEDLPMMIWKSDVDGSFTFISQNGIDFLGVPKESLLNGEWKNHLHPEDRMKNYQKYKNSILEGASFEIELRLRSKSGEYHWFHIFNKPVYTAEGRPDGYIGTGLNINDRKETEEKLQFYKLLSENARDIILFTDMQDKIIEANQKAEEVYGYTREELLGLDIQVLRRNWTLSQAQIMQANISGIFFEAVHYRKDGSSFAVEISAQGAEMGGKQVLMSIIRDVTDQKVTEKALRDSEERFRKLFENIADIVFLREFNAEDDSEGRFIEVNQRACEKLGYTREEFEHLSVRSLMAPKEQYKLREIKNSLITKGKSFHEIIHITKTGVEVPIEINAVTFEMNDRPVMLSICRDISERKKLDAMILNSERRYRSLIMNLNNGFAYNKVIYDEKGKIINLEFVVVNNAFERMFGVKNEELKGRLYTEIFPQHFDIFELYNQAYEDVVKNGRSRYYDEVYLKDFDKWFSLSTYSPEAGYFAIIITDIDHKEKAALELKRAKEEAENANRIKSEFLANMSHEIRTPINGILGMIDLTMLTALDSNQKENMITAKNCAASLLQVINDILDFSKIEAGKLMLHNQNFDLEKLIFQIIKAHYISAREKGLSLVYSLSPDIPRFLVGDPNRLQQILNNLISNAVKFTDYGQIKIDVKGTTDSGGKADIEFSVADTGIGISEENIQRLFKSFSQIDGSYTRQFGGTGLGLAISKQLVEMMGGRLWVESKEGQGSTFCFTVVLEAGSRPESRVPAVPDPSRGFRRYQVLVVEDDAVNQLFLYRILKEEGHFAEIASNGAQALSLCRSKQFDVILMDIQLPEMDGIEASRHIRQTENNKHTPIIALTAYALQGDREKFLEQGMDEYVSKPINMEELLQAMDKVITAKEHRIEIQRTPFVIKNGELVLNAAKEEISREERSSYRNQIDQNLRKLILAIENSSIAGIEGVAHEIKELCHQLGAFDLKSRAFKIELAARRGSMEAILEESLQLAQDFEIYKNFLEND